MGASAVLLFARPTSPLAQPWPILAGNLLFAYVGVTAALLIPSPLIAPAVAISMATGLMAVFRCTRPPSGPSRSRRYSTAQHCMRQAIIFLLFPVLLNSTLITLAALAYNDLTGVSYPHKADASAHPHPQARLLVVTEADFEAVLTDYGETLDIDREDFQRIYEELVGRAEERRKETASR